MVTLSENVNISYLFYAVGGFVIVSSLFLSYGVKDVIAEKRKIEDALHL